MADSAADFRSDDEDKAEAGDKAVLAKAVEAGSDQPVTDSSPPSDDDYVPV